MTPDERRRTALHESSHAVVGHVLGWRIRLVVATHGYGPRGASPLAGFCEHHRRDDLSPMAVAIDDVTILAAGERGELLFPMSGYFEPVDDDEAAIGRAADAALGTMPEDDGGFIYSVLTDSRGPGPSDAEKAAAAAVRAAGEERSQFLAFCEARAARLVWSNADLILALAAELQRRAILDGPAAEAVIAAALAGRKEPEHEHHHPQAEA